MSSLRGRAVLAAVGLLAGVGVVGWTGPAAPAPAGDASRASVTEEAVNLRRVGYHDLGGGGLNGELTVLGTTAIIGAGVVGDPGSTHTEHYNPFDCLAVSVKLVDVADPAAPRLVSTIPLPSGVAAVEIAAARVSTPFFTGDLAAIALDDNSAHTAPTRCVPSSATTQRGIAYYDITDPANPTLLGRYQADFDRVPAGAPECGPPPLGTNRCANGQHSVALVQRPDGRLLTVSTEPVASLLQYPSADVRVVDATDPGNPVQVSSWPALGERPQSFSSNGCRSSNIGHDAAFTPAGDSVPVAHGDEGLAVVDIGDPAAPATAGRFDYPPTRTVEGNASYVSSLQLGGRTFALLGEEDWHGVTSTLRVDPPSTVAGSKFGCQAHFTLFDPQGDAQVYRRPGNQIAGEIVYGGRGCPERQSGGSTIAADPYLTDPAGKIVLLDSVRVTATQPGISTVACRHDLKVKQAKQAGALGVVLARVPGAGLFGFNAGGFATSIPGDPNAVGGIPGPTDQVPLDIPLVQIDDADASPLRSALCPTVSGGSCTGGETTTGALVDSPGEWGGLRVLDVTDRAAPVEVSAYYGPTARAFPPPDLGVYSVHHAIAVGSRAYVAANADGLRVVDLSTPSSPAEVASFVPADRPDPAGQLPPAARVIGVATIPGYVLVTDVNSGLYVLELPGGGYWSVASDGGIFSFGNAPFLGSTGDLTLNSPIVGMAPTPSGLGYWLVAADGGVFAFGDAPFLGSTGDIRLNSPVVGMAATPSGVGYWLVAADGGVFAFGDAPFLGSTGDLTLNSPVVGGSASASGRGYRMVAADGGVFAFGDADFLGSTGDIRLNRPVVGMATTSTGGGYWLVADDGGVFAFGDAPFLGSTGDIRLNQPVRGMAPTASRGGYWLVAADGGVFAFGDAPFLGSTGDIRLNRPVVGMAASRP